MADSNSDDSVIFMSEEPPSASVASSKGFTINLTRDDVDIAHINKTELSDGSATSCKYLTIN